MRAKIITLLLIFTISGFGQDSLVKDSAFELTQPVLTQRKKPQKKKRVFQARKTITSKSDTTTAHIHRVDAAAANEPNSVFAAILLIAVVAAFIGYGYVNYRISKNITSRNEKGEYIFSDSTMRMFMSRRRYYNDVYLKSEEWKRKRHVVLRRDSWRCVYCGAQATEVHHERYAKRNIGKEPIEWLVSLCRVCHYRQHQ